MGALAHFQAYFAAFSLLWVLQTKQGDSQPCFMCSLVTFGGLFKRSSYTKGAKPGCQPKPGFRTLWSNYYSISQTLRAKRQLKWLANPYPHPFQCRSSIPEDPGQMSYTSCSDIFQALRSSDSSSQKLPLYHQTCC